MRISDGEERVESAPIRPGGWQLRLAPTAFERWRSQASVAPIAFSVVVLLVCALELAFCDRIAVPIGVAELGARHYEEYLSRVSVPALFLLIALALASWALLRRFPLVSHPLEEVLFFSDRIELFCGRSSRALVPKNRGESKPARVPSLAPALIALNKLVRCACGRRVLLPFPNGLYWRVRDPHGNPVRRGVRQIAERYRDLPAEEWRLSAGEILPLSVPVLLLLLQILLAFAASSVPAAPLLAVRMLTDRDASSELLRSAKRYSLFETWFYRQALRSPRPLKYEEHVRILRLFLSSGGEDVQLREEEAICELGRGRPRVALVWLWPPSGGSLEVRSFLMLGQMAEARRALARLRGPAFARREIYEAVVDLAEGDRELAQRVLQRRSTSSPRDAMLEAAVLTAAGEKEAAERLREPEVFSHLKRRTARLLAAGFPRNPREAFDRATELAWTALAWGALDRPTADRLWERAEALVAGLNLTHLLDFYRPLRESARRSVDGPEITIK